MTVFLSNSRYRAAILSEMASARTSIDIAVYHFGWFHSLRDSLANKKVRIVLNRNWIGTTDRILVSTIRKNLSDIAEVRTMRNIHAKLIILDEKKVFAGSMNLSKKSIFQNHECGIMTDDPDAVRTAIATFQRWWEVAS